MNQKLIEKLAVESLVEHDGEIIFSKEKFAWLIYRRCLEIAQEYDFPKLSGAGTIIANRIYDHFDGESTVTITDESDW
jgi:hypothetical protein